MKFWGQNWAKRYLKKRIYKNNSQVRNQHPWTLFCTKFQSTKTKHFKVLGSNLPQKSISGTHFMKKIVKFVTIVIFIEKNCQIQNLHLWILLCTESYSKTKYSEILRQILPKKGIRGTEFKKTIFGIKVNSFEYSFVPSFILSKALWNFGTKLLKNCIVGTKFKKTIVGFEISSLEYYFVSGFILSKAHSSFGTKLAQKSVLGTKFIVGHCGLYWLIVAHSTV